MRVAAVEAAVFILGFALVAWLAGCGPVPAAIDVHDDDDQGPPAGQVGDDDTADDADDDTGDDDTVATGDDDTAPACTDQCQVAGELDCTATADGTVVCADHDGDGCREWGGYVPCSGTEFCDEGQCVDECIEEGEDCEEWDDCCEDYHCCPVFHICVDDWWE